MPHIGVPELLIVLVIIVIVFGVGKLPEIGAAMGKAIRGFRDASASADKKSAGGEEPEKKEAADK